MSNGVLPLLFLLASSPAADVSPLPEPGRPVTAELSSGQTRRFTFALKEGEYVHIAVEQHGIDVVVLLLDPQGRVALEVNEIEDLERPESVHFVAGAAGEYALEVGAAVKGAAPGRYVVDVLEVRAATPRDRTRAKAEAAFAAAEKVRKQGGGAAFRQARDGFESLVPSWQELGDGRREAETLCLSGDISLGLGEAARALEALLKALALVDGKGYANLEAEILNNLGAGYYMAGVKNRALEFYERALALERSTGDRRGLMGTLVNASLARDEIGEKARALEFMKEALGLARALGDTRGEAAALSAIAKTHDDVGEKQQALDSYGQALALVRKLGEHRGEGSILSNIGRVYSSVGDNRKALVFYEQALPIRRQIGDRRGETMTLSGIGKSYEELGDDAKAAERYQEVLALSRASKDLRGEGSALSRLGLLREKAGDLDKALDLHAQALAIRRTTGERYAEGADLGRIGAVYAKRGDREKAVEYFGQSLAVARAVGDPIQEAEMLTRLAELDRRAGSLSEAREKLEAALGIIESLRTRIASPDLRSSFAALTHRTYELSVDVLMALHREEPTRGFDARAFDTAERGRARALLDLLAESGVDLREGVDPALLAQERAQRALFDAKVERRMRIVNAKHTDEQLAEADADVGKAGAEYDRVFALLRSSSPAFAALVKPEPVSLAELQRSVLSDDSVFLEYALGERRSFLWVVTPDSISSHEIPKRAEVEVAARRVHELLTARTRHEAGADEECTAAAAKLAAMVLGPAAGELKGRRLLVVADGALHYVPFSVLPLPGRTEPLVTTYQVVMLPSASVAALLARQVGRTAPAARTLSLLADPVFDAEDSRVSSRAGAIQPPEAPSGTEEGLHLRSLADRVPATRAGGLARLPFARREAQAILALVPKAERMEALDFDASLGTARRPEFGRSRFVHFATHGILNDSHPELSGLVLSLVDREGRPRAGFLSTGEIFNLTVPAELVVLSGCETALGQEVRGEGIVGVTRAFLHAGTRRVAASLWAVDDAATARLMTTFYRGMLGPRKLSPAAALREAQLEMRSSTRWKAPYYWAGFVLEGEWK